MITFAKALASFIVSAAVFGWLAWVITTPSATADAQAPVFGSAGSGVFVQAVVTNLDPMTPEEVTKGHSTCEATLTEAVNRLPRDYGTEWLWGRSNGDWAGKYFPGRDVIVISAETRCQWVPVVAAHEWSHQLQDLTGLTDSTPVNGVSKMEIVAECTARSLSDLQGWPHYDSYPERAGVPCSDFVADVQALLALA